MKPPSKNGEQTTLHCPLQLVYPLEITRSESHPEGGCDATLQETSPENDLTAGDQGEQQYSPEMFVFVDETGADRRNTLRKYGYSMRGRPALNHSFLIRGERISAISIHGLLDVKSVKGIYQ